MKLQIIWDNFTRSHITPAEFGKGMSFKNKLGAKPAMLRRTVEITMPNKINLHWKRELENRISEQFQMNKKATIYFSGFKGDETSAFVVSSRNSISFSNQVANGILEIRGQAANKNHIENINRENLMREASLK